MAPAAPAEQFRRRVRWAFGVVRRGRWLVAAVVLLTMGLTVFYLYSAKRLYSAGVEVLVEGSDGGDSLLERSYGRSRLTEATIQTEADILASASLAKKVIEKLNLAADPEFNPSLRPPDALSALISKFNPLPFLTGGKANQQSLSAEGAEQLAKTRVQGMFLSRLTVKSRRRSFVIGITFTANNGEKAALIANTLAELYVVDRLDANFQEAKRVNEWLAQRLEELRRDVATAENAAEQFRTRYALAQRRKGERQLTINDQQLIELNSRLVLARSDLAQKRARYDQLRSITRTRGSVDTAYDVLQSNLIQRLREQETVKQRELSEAMKTYGERHPHIIGQRADLDELRRKIASEIEKIASSLATELEAARVGAATLERQIEELKGSADRAGTREVELRELERQAESSRLLYEAFLGRYKRDSEQERIQRAHARVLSMAAIPGQPSSPRRLRILFGALLASGLGGLALVFLLDRLNGRIRSPDEAEQITGLPVLATVPFWKPGRKAAGTRAFAVLDDPRSAVANSFRALRAVLAVAQSGGGQVTMITSSIPQEGKSFIARNLALAIAATGNRVLIVDADLMRPVQHAALGEAPRVGLAQLLSDPDLLVKSLIVRDEVGGVDILPAGAVELESGNALANGRLSLIIEGLRPLYDRIIIDAPPSLVATDAQIVARVADQVAFVIKSNDTARDAIQIALSHLRKVGAEVTGVVLSQTRANHDPSGYYGDYGYYGAYGKYAKSN